MELQPSLGTSGQTVVTARMDEVLFRPDLLESTPVPHRPQGRGPRHRLRLRREHLGRASSLRRSSRRGLLAFQLGPEWIRSGFVPGTVRAREARASKRARPVHRGRSPARPFPVPPDDLGTTSRPPAPICTDLVSQPRSLRHSTICAIGFCCCRNLLEAHGRKARCGPAPTGRSPDGISSTSLAPCHLRAGAFRARSPGDLRGRHPEARSDSPPAFGAAQLRGKVGHARFSRATRLGWARSAPGSGSRVETRPERTSSQSAVRGGSWPRSNSCSAAFTLRRGRGHGAPARMPYSKVCDSNT